MRATCSQREGRRRERARGMSRAKQGCEQKGRLRASLWMELDPNITSTVWPRQAGQGQGCSFSAVRWGVQGAPALDPSRSDSAPVL